MKRCSGARWTDQELNQKHLGVAGDPEIATRITFLEMAYRMQSSAPEFMDTFQGISGNAQLYGAEARQTIVLR